MPQRLRDKDPIYLCWRVAAIHRCVVRFNKDRDWAKAKLREIAPDGSRDQMLDVWFMGIEWIRQSASRQNDLAVRTLHISEIIPDPISSDQIAPVNIAA